MEVTHSFGYWVLRRRKSLDLTRAELAERVGCAAETIKKIERDERRPSRQIAELLARALCLAADELPLFLQVALQHRPVDQLQLRTATLLLTPARLHNLPAPTSSFVGRERDILELKARLGDGEARLCTVLGPGGMGKTRLALQVASQLVDDYEGGVWLVELAGISDPDLVVRETAIALGVSERPNRRLATLLADFIQSHSPLLLVLDNCEHLADACADHCFELLQMCPRLQILATSRQALGVAGEAVWPLRGLTLDETQVTGIPTSDTLAPGEGGARADATRLFVDRARLVQPHFRLSTANAPAVAEICRELDGMPLAIELAAARLNVLSPDEVAARLSARFNLLRGRVSGVEARHQTLEGVVGWSYGLLDEPERRFFNRLSVFRGGFTLRAAEAVAGEPDQDKDALDLLASLLDKSMLLAETVAQPEARYRLLETLRLFGRERLTESGEQADTERRHALYFQRLAETTDPELRGPQQVTRLEGLEADHDNLLAALQWAVEHDAASGLRLASALWWFWITLGYFQEGKHWLERFISSASVSLPEHERVSAFVRYAFLMSFVLGDEHLRGLAEEALRRSRAAEDRQSTAMSLQLMAGNPYYASNISRSRTEFEESLALFREVRDAWGTAWGALMLAQLLEVRLRDYSTARRLVEEAMAISRHTGDVQGIASALFRLGELERHTGNYDLARSYYEEGLPYVRQLNNPFDIAVVIWSLSAIAGHQGDYDQAVELREASLQLFREIHQDEMSVQVLGQLGYYAFLRGDYDSAVDYCQESLRIAQESDSQRALVDTYLALGEVALRRRHFALARQEFSEALSTAVTNSLPEANCVYALEALARLAIAESNHEQAAVLLGAAEAIHGKMPFLLFPRAKENWQTSLNTARAQLSATDFAAAWNEGRSLGGKGERHVLACVVGQKRDSWAMPRAFVVFSE